LDPLFNGVGNRTAYFLYSWRWWIEDPERIAFARDVEVEHRRCYPKHHFIHLCNTLPQLDIFRAVGLEAFFCPQNALVDERLFLPLSTVPKKFDAVYDARLKRYKRHSLARDIESLALIYAFDTDIDDHDCAEQIRRQLPHAHFFNHPGPDTYQALSPEEVNVCLNSSRVGLCLSAVEGTMYASIQYLLCGLPVVSTTSKGGRDIFFDEVCARIVDPDPGAVKEGVQDMVKRAVRPGDIRARTLEKLRRHRGAFIAAVQDIYDREGVRRIFEVEWNHVFFNKLFREKQRHDEVLSRLAAGC
jgi:glycosyltransferase involved in cell wall biosynthesis